MQSLIQYIQESLLITEHVVNLFYSNTNDVKKMHEYSKEVWDLVSNAYKYCGGVAGCPDYESFVKFYVDCVVPEKLFWKMVRRNGKITCIKIYTLKRQGRKGIIIASLDSPEGKHDIGMILRDDYTIKERDAWDELSGKALSFALKNGGVPLPSSMIKVLMPDKDAKLMDDGYFYERTIGGQKHIKCIIGIPKHKEEKDIANSPELINHIKELAKKYSEQESK